MLLKALVKKWRTQELALQGVWGLACMQGWLIGWDIQMCQLCKDASAMHIASTSKRDIQNMHRNVHKTLIYTANYSMHYVSYHYSLVLAWVLYRKYIHIAEWFMLFVIPMCTQIQQCTVISVICSQNLCISILFCLKSANTRCIRTCFSMQLTLYYAHRYITVCNNICKKTVLLKIWCNDK